MTFFELISLYAQSKEHNKEHYAILHHSYQAYSLSIASNDIDLCRILASAEHGERDAAFTELYARYSTSLYSYCFGMTGNKESADDLFQETFLRFYHAATQNLIEKPQHYLVRIARNLHISKQRKQQETLVEPEALDIRATEQMGYEHEELYALVIRSLDLLDERQREVFVLREFDGLSYQEIAEVCNISLSNAKMIGVRAKQRITRILQPYISDINKFNNS